MSTEPIRYARVVRHTDDGVAVTRMMGSVRAAFPFVRAMVLAALVTLLIMVGLPAMLAMAAGAH